MRNILTVRDLTLAFGGLLALHQVSFDVSEGSITAIIGPNGAGKTTAFNCITGFYRANTGHVQLGEVELTSLLGGPLQRSHFKNFATLGRQLHAMGFGGPHLVNRAGVARTFQNIRLFREMTVIENLLVAQHQRVNTNLLSGLLATAHYRRCEAAALVRAKDILTLVGLLPEANRLAGELPYGSQRRLEIARALCSGPRLLCLDEPAAGLNPQETRDLSHLLRAIRDSYHITILLIEHDMELVMGISDHVVVLDHGEVIAQGKPSEVRTNPRVLEAYLGIPDDEDREA